ncbi:autorepressor SdpR family transcription factor [Parasphingorhabdus sp.]|jgi:ArsR family transcriptional regulator, repressor of sdpIR and other operons|uniref:autorepressor SdpR family transcription factor n=1 Tax=Parasphingorhabdus sp. TaxID=2709688 RepID=UPI003BAED01F
MLNSSVFKAIAHPVRRDILKRLRAGPQTAGDLAQHYAMSKPSLSAHFAVLKDADLVFTRRQGNFIFYNLNLTVADEILSTVMDLFGIEEGSRHDP